MFCEFYLENRPIIWLKLMQKKISLASTDYCSQISLSLPGLMGRWIIQLPIGGHAQSVARVWHRWSKATERKGCPCRQLGIHTWYIHTVHKIYEPHIVARTTGVNPYGTGGHVPSNIWTGRHYHECPPIFDIVINWDILIYVYIIFMSIASRTVDCLLCNVLSMCTARYWLSVQRLKISD